MIASGPIPALDTMVAIPGGSYLFHATHRFREGGFVLFDEGPRDVQVQPFHIDRYEVTNVEYRRFLDRTGYRPPVMHNFLRHWRDGFPEHLADHPVTWVSLEDARANSFKPDMSEKAPPPEQPGLYTFPDWDLADLVECFDWTPFFRAWELAGTFPAILHDEVVGESARSLYADAKAMLDKIVAEKWLTAKGVAGFWPCAREGDDVVLHIEGPQPPLHLPFLRPQ